MPQYIKINIADFAGTETIPFNIYSKPRDKNEAVLFLRAGVKIPEERLLELRDSENLTFFLEMSDLQAYREFFADKLVSKDIHEYIELPVSSDNPLRGGPGAADPLEYMRLRNIFWGAALVSAAEVYIGMPFGLAVVIAGIAAYFVFIATTIRTAGYFKNREKNSQAKPVPRTEIKVPSPAPAPAAPNAPASVAPASPDKNPAVQPSRAPLPPRSRMPAAMGSDKLSNSKQKSAAV